MENGKRKRKAFTLKEKMQSRDHVNEWLNFDNDCPVADRVSDAEIVQNIMFSNTNGDNDNGDASDDTEDTTPEDNPPSATDAVRNLECALRWMEMQDIDYVRILQLRNMIEFAKSKHDSS